MISTEFDGNVLEKWLNEEKTAKINGWDFSHIDGRYKEYPLPWNFREIIHKYLNKDHKLLDIDTGGGEFLLTLKHNNTLTYATEGYMPNVQLCREKFGKLGINFKEMTAYSDMPFEDNFFDVVINRHGSYDAEEIYRILKPGGVFITQQVGEDNDRGFIEMLLPGSRKPFSGHNLANQVKLFENAGFKVCESAEVMVPIEFYDSSALVWFAKIIEWEFEGFSVQKCFDRLLDVEREIRGNGCVKGYAHRFFMVMKK